MKKILLPFLALSVLAFAYTETDVSNANYLATKGIITQQSTAAGYRLDDTITRAEVAGIALKLSGTQLPENYQCKKYFSDVTKNDWVCRAVEIAADKGFVSRNNKIFRPQDTITRAEYLAIILKSGNAPIVDDTKCYLSFNGDYDNTTPLWIKKIYCSVLYYNIYFTGSETAMTTTVREPMTTWIEGVQTPAKRSEVIKTLLGTLRFKKYDAYFNQIKIATVGIIGSNSLHLTSQTEQVENEKLIYDNIVSKQINISTINTKISGSTKIHEFDPFSTFINSEKIILVKEFPKNCISFLYAKPYIDNETWLDEMKAGIEIICASDMGGLDIFNKNIEIDKYKSLIENQYGKNVSIAKLNELMLNQMRDDFQKSITN